MVGDEGVEPSTSSLSEKRSTAELVTQNFGAGSEKRSTTELRTLLYHDYMTNISSLAQIASFLQDLVLKKLLSQKSLSILIL
jgi:hypothetical protein